jgi:Flp pilus assembly protein TadG
MRVNVRSVSRTPGFRRGAAAVELAAILPTLMLLVLGCIDFGRFAYTYIAVTNAARAGAGVGIMSDYPATSASLTDWQKLICTAAANEIWGVNTTFTAVGSSDPNGYTNSQGLYVNAAPVTTGETGSLWRVQVTARYTFKTLVPWPRIPNTIPLQRVVVLRVIR